MWIEETTNTKGTRYKYYERFSHPLTGKTIKVSVTLNSKSRHAQKEAARLLQEKFTAKTTTAQQQRAAKVATLTLKNLCDEWIENTLHSVKPQTIKSRKTYIRKLLTLLPPNVLLTEITPPMIEKAFTKMYYTQNLSILYTRFVMNTCKQVLRYAKKSRYIDDIRDYEEIKLKKRPPTSKELHKKANKFLNADELADCLRQTKKLNMRVGLAMEFIALTGLRIGELLALREIDCDLANKSISVNGNIYIAISKTRGTPKNVYSYRIVYINQRACNIIKWFKADNIRLMRWTKTTYKDLGYIFTCRHGTPLNYSTVYQVLSRVTVTDKHITPHIFRHTYVSMLSEKNIPLKSIMQQVGHHDPQTTLAIYTHVTDSMSDETRTKIDELVI